MTFVRSSYKLRKMTKNDEKKCHLKNDKIERILLKMMKFILKLCLLRRENLFDRVCYNMNEWKQLLLYLYLWTNIFVNKSRTVAANFVFAGIESRIFVFVLIMSSWISPKISSKSCGVIDKSFLYSDSSSNLSTSFSDKPGLIFLPSQGFTHADLFIYFFFFFKQVVKQLHVFFIRKIFIRKWASKTSTC